MAKVVINDEYLTDIAVAIRTKNFSENQYKPKEMAEAILAIRGGDGAIEALKVDVNGLYEAPEGVDGYNPVLVDVQPTIESLEINENGTYEVAEGVDGYSPITVDVQPTLEALEITANGTYTPGEGVDGFSSVVVNMETGLEIPASALAFTNIGQYLFVQDKLSWFIQNTPELITCKKMSGCSYMFHQSSDLTEVPFDIEITSECKNFDYMFQDCLNLKSVPRIIGGNLTAPLGDYNGNASFNYMFSGCEYLREIPDNFFMEITGADYWEAAKNFRTTLSNTFLNCYSLRKLPDISMMTGKATNAYGSVYQLQNLVSLDEVLNLPVANVAANAEATNNLFSSFLNNGCYRIQRITFVLNEDGTPQVAKWKGQTMDFSKLGAMNTTGSGIEAWIINRNSGITIDKRVKDDESYQRLKNDPDWYSYGDGFNYCRYNKISAIETINTLPDTSAYLAEKGGTNTIKFRGTAGAKTDGGAINTMTEEEIAVAAAKGWTITFV